MDAINVTEAVAQNATQAPVVEAQQTVEELLRLAEQAPMTLLVLEEAAA